MSRNSPRLGGTRGGGSGGGLVPLLPRWGPVVEPETHVMLVIWKVLSSCKTRRAQCVCLLLCRVGFARIIQARGRRPARIPRHLSQSEAGDGHRAPGDWGKGCPSELQVRTLFTKAEANTDPRRPSNQKGKEKKKPPSRKTFESLELRPLEGALTTAHRWKVS